MPIKTFFKKSSDVLVETVQQSVETVTESVKSILAGTVADYEAKWIEAEADVDRAQAQFDEMPTPENRAKLQAARAALEDITEELNSARRREQKRHETIKAKETQAVKNRCEDEVVQLTNYAIQDVEPLFQHVETVVMKFIDHRNRVLESAAAAHDNEVIGHAQHAIGVFEHFMNRALMPLTGVTSSDDPTHGRPFSDFLPKPKVR